MKSQTSLVSLTLLWIASAIFPNTVVHTYKLRQSTSANTLWTTTPSVRIFKDTQVPQKVDSSLFLYCAKNETEPLVVVIKPSQNKSVTVSMDSFSSGIGIELYQVKYVTIKTPSDNLGKAGDYPDPLQPIADNSGVAVTANENCALWISVYVPSDAREGDYTSSITIDGITVPLRLHVFNVTIPPELHIASQMNFSYEAILTKYGVAGTGAEYWKYVDMINTFFIRHRLTPRNPLWPGALAGSGGECFIDYDCNGILSDPHGVWGFEQPSEKYIRGAGFNSGSGFPLFEVMTFKNNDASSDQRPSHFCQKTLTASDWYTGNNSASQYNTAWFTYIKAVQEYLAGRNLLEKAYYYLANEPQNQADYDAVAWYSQELKKAAPQLKLMVSEEPRREIFSHPKFTGVKIDIWLPVLHSYNPEISWEREKSNGEQTWIYFLHGTRSPWFNPITLDHPGIESKLTGWFLWKYRIKGIAYYSLNDWSKNPWIDPLTDGHNGDLFMLYPPSESNAAIVYGSNNHRLTSSIRFELMRDGFEDFEYLYLLNNKKIPEVNVTNSTDRQADKIIAGLTSYCRDDEFMYNLRRLIGLKLGGEIETIPDIETRKTHPRALGAPGKYYINFQDPTGEPKATPLFVNGCSWMKIGWNSYNDSLGYGWYGDLTHVKYAYVSGAANDLQRSVIYDDWGRQKTFEFDCPNGEYGVEVSVGWHGKSYQHQRIKIEGFEFVNDEGTTAANPYIVRKKNVHISDNKLTMEMGIFDEYTMLNYLAMYSTGSNVNRSVSNPSGSSILMINEKKTMTLEFKGALPKTVEIFDLCGKSVFVTTVMSRCFAIEKSRFRKGVYFCVVNFEKSKEGEIFSVW